MQTPHRKAGKFEPTTFLPCYPLHQCVKTPHVGHSTVKNTSKLLPYYCEKDVKSKAHRQKLNHDKDIQKQILRQISKFKKKSESVQTFNNQ